MYANISFLFFSSKLEVFTVLKFSTDISSRAAQNRNKNAVRITRGYGGKGLGKRMNKCSEAIEIEARTRTLFGNETDKQSVDLHP